MATTNIEWVRNHDGTRGNTWNPVTGCTPISQGCAHCYAARMAKRLAGRYGYPADEPFRVTLHADRLQEPLRWKKPRRVFVASMGDLFHDAVPFDFIDRVWSRFYDCPQHTFLVLTKRPARMRQWLVDELHDWRPLPNVWLGVTAENQVRADERVPVLLDTPAAVRFVSIEPLLERVDPRDLPLDSKTYVNALTGRQRYAGAISGFSSSTGTHLSWIIAGGETGPGARPMHPDWARALRDQCQNAGVPFFFKSWGDWAEVRTLTPEITERFARAHHGYSDGTLMFRVGKKRAGRTLDGRTWDQLPEVRV